MSDDLTAAWNLLDPYETFMTQLRGELIRTLGRERMIELLNDPEFVAWLREILMNALKRAGEDV